jgi:hypothetical protein
MSAGEQNQVSAFIYGNLVLQFEWVGRTTDNLSPKTSHVSQPEEQKAKARSQAVALQEKTT